MQDLIQALLAIAETLFPIGLPFTRDADDLLLAMSGAGEGVDTFKLGRKFPLSGKLRDWVDAIKAAEDARLELGASPPQCPADQLELLTVLYLQQLPTSVLFPRFDGRFLLKVMLMFL